MSNCKLLSIVFVLLLIVSTFGGVLPTDAESEDYEQAEEIQVIIGFGQKPDFLFQDNVKEVRSLVNKDGGKVKHEFHTISAMTASLSPKTINTLSKNPNIAYIEPDYRVKAFGETLTWGVDHIDEELSGSGTEDACDVTPDRNACDEIKIAILDTGIDMNHRDLDDNVAGGVCFFGWFDDGKTAERYWEDKNGHGTLCAGVIASEDNGEGITGVAPNASLYAVKVLDNGGNGRISDTIQGIEWCMENDMDIISMAFGGRGDSKALRDACDAAYESGILLVAGSGNNGDGNPDTLEVLYPAFYDSVIAVGATKKDDTIWQKSNSGDYIELVAPGTDITSTYLDGAYAIVSGTFISCSHVAGVASLSLAANPTSSNVKVRKWLKATAKDLGEEGKDSLYGYGLIDAQRAALPGASKMPPMIKILCPDDDSTYASTERNLSWITDEACDFASYSLNGEKNVTVIKGALFIEGNTSLKAQNGSNNLIFYCKDLRGNIGCSETNFEVDKTILYRFVQITDPHVDSVILIDYDAKIISHSKEIFEDSLDEIRYSHDPDMIILTGDITDKGTRNDLELSKDILDEKADNWYAVAGNHDVLLNESYFPTIFSNGENWSFVDENSGSLFIGIGSSKEHFIEGTVPKDQLTFLDDTLRRYAGEDKTAFVFKHHTLQKVNRCLIRNSDEVNQVLWSYTDDYRKIVQLCGHVHLNNRTDENNVTYLITSALISYPMEYRIVDIRKDSINMTMGGPAHPEYSLLSLIEANWTNYGNYGTDHDRIVNIDLSNTDLSNLSNGKASPEITHPHNSSGDHNLSLSVTDDNGETDTTSETLHRIYLTSSPRTIPADGISTLTITAQLKDNQGNDVTRAGVPVDFTASRGDLSDILSVTDENGRVAVTVSSKKRGVALVRASSEDVMISGLVQVWFRGG